MDENTQVVQEDTSAPEVTFVEVDTAYGTFSIRSDRPNRIQYSLTRTFNWILGIERDACSTAELDLDRLTKKFKEIRTWMEEKEAYYGCTIPFDTQYSKWIERLSAMKGEGFDFSMKPSDWYSYVVEKL